MSRLRRRAIAAVVALLGTVALLVPAAPALAAPHSETYAFMDRSGGGGIGSVDIDGVVIVICKACGFWVDIQAKEGRPETVGQLNGALLGGVQLLGKAATAATPGLAARYQAQAMAQFTTAARIAGPAGVGPIGVGIVDTERRAFQPDPLPWLYASAGHLAAGINFLEQAFADPEPSPWRQAAAAQFQTAYQELATKQAVEG